MTEVDILNILNVYIKDLPSTTEILAANILGHDAPIYVAYLPLTLDNQLINKFGTLTSYSVYLLPSNVEFRKVVQWLNQYFSVQSKEDISEQPKSQEIIPIMKKRKRENELWHPILLCFSKRPIEQFNSYKLTKNIIEQTKIIEIFQLFYEKSELPNVSCAMGVTKHTFECTREGHTPIKLNHLKHINDARFTIISIKGNIFKVDIPVTVRFNYMN